MMITNTSREVFVGDNRRDRVALSHCSRSLPRLAYKASRTTAVGYCGMLEASLRYSVSQRRVLLPLISENPGSRSLVSKILQHGCGTAVDLWKNITLIVQELNHIDVVNTVFITTYMMNSLPITVRIGSTASLCVTAPRDHREPVSSAVVLGCMAPGRPPHAALRSAPRPASSRQEASL